MTDSSPFEVEWTASAQRALDRLPENVALAVIEFVHSSLADNPRRLGGALHFEMDGLHSARRGAYRIIYAIDEEGRVISIAAVGHRADVYRPRS